MSSRVDLVKSVAGGVSDRVFGNIVVKVAMHICLFLNFCFYLLVTIVGILWYVALENDTVAVLSDASALTVIGVEDGVLLMDNGAEVSEAEVVRFVNMRPGLNERFLPEEGIYARSVTTVEYVETIIKWLLACVFFIVVSLVVLNAYRGRRRSVIVSIMAVISSWFDMVLAFCGAGGLAFVLVFSIIATKVMFIIKVGTFSKD